MANNDRLKQIISNVERLSELTQSMKDSEIYPVSFFSEAFDLIQKIQKEFHTLEAEQVDLFSTHMKKRQALITSIHQQVLNIEEQKAVSKQDETNTLDASVLPKETRKRDSKKTEIIPEKPKPVVTKKDNNQAVAPPKKETTPAAKTVDEETRNTSAQSVNDLIEKKKLSDLRKAFSINERFRYLHNLFHGNEGIMNETIKNLNAIKSYEKTTQYIKEKLKWDFDDEVVKEFMKVLEARFL